jgi:hypothetical protein
MNGEESKLVGKILRYGDRECIVDLIEDGEIYLRRVIGYNAYLPGIRISLSEVTDKISEGLIEVKEA